MFPRQASKRLCAGGCLSRPPALNSVKESVSRETLRSRLPVRRCGRKVGSTLNSVRPGLTSLKQRERVSAFTLLELLIVIGIIAILLVLIAPAFTNLKSAGDVTSAAYTIKDVLDTARTYAKANNTYTWVGFYEEDVSQPSTNPATAGTGRIVMSIVASKDGTRVYDPSNLTTISPTQLLPVGKLTKIENAHLWTHTDTPTGTGSTFDTRPNVASTYCVGNSSPAGSATPFQYPVGNPAPTAQYP